MKLFLIGSLLLCILLAGCSEQKPGADAASSLEGTLEGGTFRNEFFGFRFTVPEGWTVADEEKRRSLLGSLKVAAPGREQAQLVLYREAEGGAAPDIFLITTEPNPSPTVSGLDDGFAFLRRTAPPEAQVVRGAHSAAISGVQFARAEVRERGAGQYFSHAALGLRGHLLSFQVHSMSRRRMEDVARQMGEAIAFE